MYQNTESYKCPFICTMILYETTHNKKTFLIYDRTSNNLLLTRTNSLKFYQIIKLDNMGHLPIITQNSL
jgi:hypothetical protein